MGRRKKKEVEIPITCYMCSYFIVSKIKRRESEKENIIRRCHGNDISGDDLICDLFIPCNSFWCDKHGIRLYLEACKARKEKKFSECPKHCMHSFALVSLIHIYSPTSIIGSLLDV